jgi:ABC-type sugar transport system permease subunit
LGNVSSETNILPALKDAWNLPEFATPFPYYSNQRIGKMYAEPWRRTRRRSIPVRWTMPRVTWLDRAFNRSAEYYASHGENGLAGKDPGELGRGRRGRAPAGRIARRSSPRGRNERQGDQRPLRPTGRPRYKGKAPYLFLSPYIVLTAVFFAVPFFNAILLAFYETNGPRSRAFVGWPISSFCSRIRSSGTALLNTTLFAMVSVFVQLPLSMAWRCCSTLGRKVKRILSAGLLFAQSGRPGSGGHSLQRAALAALWSCQRGFSQAILHWGLETQLAWRSANFIMPAIILVSLWLWVGFNMVYFLAALQTVDKSLEEAARVDGANPWQVFWHVTLPSMRHVVVFVVIMSIIGSYQLFELPLTLLNESNGLGTDNAGLDANYLSQLPGVSIG